MSNIDISEPVFLLVTMFVGDLDPGDVIDTVVVVGKVGHGDDPPGGWVCS